MPPATAAAKTKPSKKTTARHTHRGTSRAKRRRRSACKLPRGRTAAAASAPTISTTANTNTEANMTANVKRGGKKPIMPDSCLHDGWCAHTRQFDFAPAANVRCWPDSAVARLGKRRSTSVVGCAVRDANEGNTAQHRCARYDLAEPAIPARLLAAAMEMTFSCSRTSFWKASKAL